MKQILKGTVVSPLTLSLMIIGVLVMAVGSAFATKMLHRNAQELATKADRVFIGVCVSVAENRDGNMIYTEYTFEVLENIKGVGSGTIVFRQFGRTKGVGSVIGMPFYDNDKKYLMFLHGDTQLGLTSPIGLGQGAFHVIKKDDGSEVAINAFHNRGLFHRMDSKLTKTTLNAAETRMMAITSGPVNLDHFVGFVKKMVR